MNMVSDSQKDMILELREKFNYATVSYYEYHQLMEELIKLEN